MCYLKILYDSPVKIVNDAFGEMAQQLGVCDAIAEYLIVVPTHMFTL